MPPAAVVQPAVTEQRIELRMARDPRLARGVLVQLPRKFARDVADDVAARRDLLRLAPNKPGPPIRLGPALPVARLRSLYAEAERRSGVAWQVLAAVNFVESDFGRLRESSVDGAQGPMQFMPATWASLRTGRRPRPASGHPGGRAVPPGRRGARRRAGRAPALQPLEPVRGRGRAVRREDPAGPGGPARFLRPRPHRPIGSRPRRESPALILRLKRRSLSR